MRARGHETRNEQTANGKLYGRTGVRLLARFPPSKSFQREPSALGAADRVPGDPVSSGEDWARQQRRRERQFRAHLEAFG